MMITTIVNHSFIYYITIPSSALGVFKVLPFVANELPHPEGGLLFKIYYPDHQPTYLPRHCHIVKYHHDSIFPICL